jgi:hypothetical protein
VGGRTINLPFGYATKEVGCSFKQPTHKYGNQKVNKKLVNEAFFINLNQSQKQVKTLLNNKLGIHI